MANINYNFYSFIKSPDTRKIITAIIIAFLFIAIPLTVYFVQQQQTTQQHATGVQNVNVATSCADVTDRPCEYNNGLGGPWSDTQGFTRVPAVFKDKGQYYTYHICDISVWKDAWQNGCPNPHMDRTKVKKFLFRKTTPCVNCQDYNEIFAGTVNIGGIDYFKTIDTFPHDTIFPGFIGKNSRCILWQMDTTTGGRHSYGDQSGCNTPTNTPTPTTPKATNTPTPTSKITSTPTPTTIITNTPTPIVTPTITATPTLTVTPTLTLTPTMTITGTPAPTSTPTPTPTNTPVFTPTPTPNTPLVINRSQQTPNAPIVINQTQPTQAPAPTRVPTTVPSGNTAETIGLITAGSLLILIGGILILL